MAAVSGPATYTFIIEDSATRSQTSNVSRTLVTTAGNGGGLEIDDGERVKIEVEDAAGFIFKSCTSCFLSNKQMTLSEGKIGRASCRERV